MPLFHDPKALTDSLELDYVDRPRPLNLWLRCFTWTAGGVALLWTLWALWPSNHTVLQAGPLADPHAMFNQDCGKCHQSAFATAMRLMPEHASIRSTPPQACLLCHPGPDHQKGVDSQDCASCHKEHRGLTMLSRPDDQHCTKCHSNLPEKRADTKFLNVASFSAHPEFRTPPDSGTVEFSHQKHMQLRADDATALKNVSGLLATSQAAMARLQEMQCNYCHQPDAAGRYMQPIQFDKHCQACHPLFLHVKIDPVPDLLKTEIRLFQKDPLPHPARGQTALNVRATARERYLRFVQGNISVLAVKPPALADLFVLPGFSKRAEPVSESQLTWVNDQWKHAESLLFDKNAGCARCHSEVSPKETRPDALPDIGTPAIPTRWLKHGLFDHQAHRMLDCNACHEGASKSESRQDVLMPKLKSCQECHQARPGFARADCVECHLFHPRSESSTWRGKLTIKDCTGN